MDEGFVGGLRVASPEPALHQSSLVRQIATTFWGDTEESTMAIVGDAFRPGGSYSWTDSRIGLTDDGSIGTHAGVVDFQMRVGETSQLHAAGLCAIFTVEAHRRRGWMRYTMNDLLTALPRAGYDISVLFGIDDFYHRFDYRRAWPEVHFEARTVDLPTGETADLEVYEDEQPPELVALARVCQQGQTGTVVREGGWFTKLVEDRAYLWRDQGEAAGYVMTRSGEEHLLVTDHGGDPDQVMSVARQLADALKRDRVRFQAIAPQGDLARGLRRMASRETIQHQRNGGALVRLVHLRRTLEKMLPDLGARLQKSERADWDGVLCFDSDDEVVCLSVADGVIQITDAPVKTPHEISGPGLAQMVIGADAPDVLIGEGGLAVNGEGGLLAQVLFPALYPFMPTPDHF